MVLSSWSALSRALSLCLPLSLSLAPSLYQPCSPSLLLLFNPLQSRCARERRGEKTDICLTKSSEEATLFDPLPNSQRPLSFGHPSLALSLSHSQRSCDLCVCVVGVCFGWEWAERERKACRQWPAFYSAPFSCRLLCPCFPFLLQLVTFVVCCWGQTGTGRRCCKQRSCLQLCVCVCVCVCLCLCLCLGDRQTEREREGSVGAERTGWKARVSQGLPLCFTHSAIHTRWTELHSLTHTTCEWCCVDLLAPWSLQAIKVSYVKFPSRMCCSSRNTKKLGELCVFSLVADIKLITSVCLQKK